MANALDVNIAAYEEQRADLEIESPGKWALFQGGRLVNVYDDYDVAGTQAERRFGQGPYLIQQIHDGQDASPEMEPFEGSDLPALDLSDDTRKRSYATLALQFAWKTFTIVAVIALWIADRIIDTFPALFDLYMRLANKDMRRMPPTKRVAWPKGLKERLMSRQRNRCAYCGSRFTAHLFEIDHMDPASRGGTNLESNLQVLCRRCNGRKAESTDAEFRRRFRGLVPPRRLTPPSPPVPQSRFDAVAARTRAAAGVSEFRRTRYIGTAQKIGAGSAVLGFVTFGVTQVGLNQLVPWEYWWYLTAPLGILVGGGLYLRAWRTGALNL